MTSITSIRALAIASLAAIVLTGCGGGGTQTINGPLQGSGALPGGAVSNGQTAGGSPQGVQGGSLASEAPLGVDPAYNVTYGGSTQTVFDPPHGTSVVAGPATPPVPTSGFDIIDLTMMPDGATVDWTLTHASFHMGDKIDIWIKYQMYSPSMNLDRHWDAPDINLAYYESAIPTTTGTYSVKLDWAVPYGTAINNAIFKYDLTGNGTNKVSPNFLYDIVASSGSASIQYPSGGDGDTNPVTGYGAGWAQLVAEDLLTNSDADYNDFVGRMQATEYRNSAGNLTQIKMRIKAIARGAGYDADWQLNFGASFPGATAWAIVDQYYENNKSTSSVSAPVRHGNQRIWQSSNGVSIPVFTPLRGALPAPPTSFATNTVSGTKWMDGDYADVTIFFNAPVTAGTYTPLPYAPELRVQPSSGSAYTVSWWNHNNGSNVGTQDNDTGYPLAFIVPDTYAWPLEYVNINGPYPGFATWAAWAVTPNAGDTRDPNTYLVSPAPATSGSQFGGSPQIRTYWTGSSGQTDFHLGTPPTGQMTTINLLKYLNGDGTQTSNSISKVVLNPFKSTKSYFSSSLPLPTTNIDNSGNTSDGYTRLKSYITGATTSKPIEYQLGAELATLVLNVERGRISPTEWTYIPEYGQIRAVVSDPLITSQPGVISAANTAFALATSTANDATKTKWFNVCKRLNANTYFVQDQPQPEPMPRWYDQAPTGSSYFKRSLFN